MGLLWRVLAPGPAVATMFSISGFLCAASYERCKVIKAFYLKRIVRIYPALIVVVLIPIIIYISIGATQITLRGLLRYLIRGITLGDAGKEYLPDGAMGNGSLWTVFIQVQFYAITPLLMLLLRKTQKVIHVGAGGVFLLVSLVMPIIMNRSEGIVNSAFGVSCLPYLYMYYVGVYLYVYRKDDLRFLIKWFPLILVVYCIAHYVIGMDTFKGKYYINPLSGFLISIIAISGAYALGAYKFKVDISYGIYLWHMAVLDIVTVIFGVHDMALFLSTISITLLIAFSSYWFVEKTMCSLLNRSLKKVIK